MRFTESDSLILSVFTTVWVLSGLVYLYFELQQDVIPTFFEAHYATYHGAGNRDGSTPENAFSLYDLNSGENWSEHSLNDNRIGPGDTVYLSGTFYGSIEVQGSGEEKYPITFDAITTNYPDVWFVKENIYYNTCHDTDSSIFLSDGAVDYITINNVTFYGDAEPLSQEEYEEVLRESSCISEITELPEEHLGLLTTVFCVDR